MDKVRAVAGIVLAPVMLVALALSAVSAVLAGAWGAVAFSKAKRQRAAVEAALKSFMKITDKIVEIQ